MAKSGSSITPTEPHDAVDQAATTPGFTYRDPKDQIKKDGALAVPKAKSQPDAPIHRQAKSHSTTVQVAGEQGVREGKNSNIGDDERTRVAVWVQQQSAIGEGAPVEPVHHQTRGAHRQRHSHQALRAEHAHAGSEKLGKPVVTTVDQVPTAKAETRQKFVKSIAPGITV